MEINKLDVLILTAYTDNIAWNNYGKNDWALLSLKNHIEYANYHNYSFHCEIVPIEKLKKIHPTWIKIYLIKKFLRLYKYVVWIDSDAIFLNYEIGIFDLLGTEKDFANLVLTKSEKLREKNIIYTNISTGFIIAKNDINTIKLFDNLISYKGILKSEEGFFHEQSLLSNYIEKFPFEKRNDTIFNFTFNYEYSKISKIKILPYNFQRIYNEIDSPYIFHAGGDTPSKSLRIKESLKNKYYMLNINYHFNDGVFLEILGTKFHQDKRFKIILIDNDSNKILNKWEDIKINHWIMSGYKNYINWKIQILDNENLIWEYEIDLKNQPVLFDILEISTQEIKNVLIQIENFINTHNCIGYILANEIEESIKISYKSLFIFYNNEDYNLNNDIFYASYKIKDLNPKTNIYII